MSDEGRRCLWGRGDRDAARGARRLYCDGLDDPVRGAPEQRAVESHLAVRALVRGQGAGGNQGRGLCNTMLVRDAD